MKKNFYRIFPLFLFFMLACPTKVVPPPDDWPFETNAIKIHYKADVNLNLYEGRSHSIVLCIYQLTDPNAFNDTRKDRDGLIKLFECNRFDKSVVSFNKYFISPGDEETLVLDRGENVKFCGIAAGYYKPWPKHAARLFIVPVTVQKKGLIIKKRIGAPGELSLNLLLGPQEIQEIGVK